MNKRTVILSILIGLTVSCFVWTKPWVKPIARKQSVEEVLKAAATMSHIKNEDLPSVIESAKKGDLNSVGRLRTHYFLVGPWEKYHERMNFGEPPPKADSKDDADDLPHTQKLLEAMREGLSHALNVKTNGKN